MRLRHYLVSLFAVLAIVSCASSGDEPSPFDQTVAESVAAEAPSSSVPTTRAVPRALSRQPRWLSSMNG